MTDNSADNDRKTQKAFAEKINNTVGTIRANLQNQGGNIELVGIGRDKAVMVQVYAGSGCPAQAQKRLETGVKELMKLKVPEVSEVITV